MDILKFRFLVQVSRQNVRDSVLRIDPAGVALRTTERIQRRTYSVAGPNSLWHIDGNHKLIRFVRLLFHEYCYAMYCLLLCPSGCVTRVRSAKHC